MAYDQLKLDNQLCFRLYTASRLIMGAYAPYFKEFGITYPQYLVLMCLWENDNCIVSDITNRLHLETNTITPILQRMEKQGLVVRQKSQNDSRQRIITLTEKGRNLEEQIKHVPGCLATGIIEKGESVEGIQSLLPLLDQLINAMK